MFNLAEDLVAEGSACFCLGQSASGRFLEGGGEGIADLFHGGDDFIDRNIEVNARHSHGGGG